MVKEFFTDTWVELTPAELEKRRADLAVIIEALDPSKEKSLKAVKYIFKLSNEEVGSHDCRVRILEN